jgi:hypothetical protein
VGWAYLAARVRAGSVGALSDALPAMLDRTFRSVLAPRPAKDEEPVLETCAYLGHRAGADVYRRSLRDVILPGFEQLGVDLGPARERVRERGWL